MNKERRNAVLIVVGAVIVGIFLGLLVPGLFHKLNERGGHGRGDRGHGKGDDRPVNKKEWFKNTLYHIIEPDNSQLSKIEPITQWASKRIDSLEASSNRQLASVLDSVRAQLKPIITEEQFKRLSEFKDRADGHWRGKGRDR
jgi:hypothetical protein